MVTSRNYLMTKKERAFIKVVWAYYTEHGRHQLPWRETHDPYCIAVSEIMLQQTQVARVTSKYQEFVARWPDCTSLAAAPLGDVLVIWQGLGYNRRAKMLHECAKAVVVHHNGVFPQSYTELQSLPGIGPYTAGAICAFAFNIPEVMIETNIRTVFLFHFFKNKVLVSDSELLPLIARTLDAKQPGKWYAALMDYGAYLKRVHGNSANRKSAHYSKQSRFEGSDRQIRGAIVRVIHTQTVTKSAVQKALSKYDISKIDAQFTALCEEGMVQKYRQRYRLPR